MYLTHSINADISFVVRAGGPVFDLAGHGEEEVKVFGNAVQLTDVFICTQNIHTYTARLGSIKKKKATLTDSHKFLCDLIKLKLLWLLCCNLLHIQYVHILLRLNWRRQELTMNAPGGIHVGLQVYFAVQISYHRQVSTAVFD